MIRSLVFELIKVYRDQRCRQRLSFECPLQPILAVGGTWSTIWQSDQRTFALELACLFCLRPKHRSLAFCYLPAVA